MIPISTPSWGICVEGDAIAPISKARLNDSGPDKNFQQKLGGAWPNSMRSHSQGRISSFFISN